MKPIGVLTDSHSGITQAQADRLGVMVLPMPFTVDGIEYYEDLTLSRAAFLKKLIDGASVSTSQPSPQAVMQFWDAALEQYEQVVYIPISRGLSSAYSTAVALSNEPPYSGRVFVVDSGRVSTPLSRFVLDALDLIRDGYSASQIRQILDNSRGKMVIYVAVDNLEYLKRGGRISSSSAFIGTLLNIKPVLRFDVGTLEAYKKCRGFAMARRAMIDAMRNDLTTKFREQYERGEVHLLAASSSGKEDTSAWVAEIEQAFPNMPVMCEDLSLAVSCHIGPNGLGIACSCHPERLI